MEFSAALMIKEVNQFNTLEKLQLSKLNSRIASIEFNIPFPHKLFATGLAIIILSGLANYFLINSPIGIRNFERQNHMVVETLIPDDSIKTQLDGLEIKITPPYYTGIKSSKLGEGNLMIPEGTEVQWNFKFNNVPIKGNLVLEGQDTIDLLKSNVVTKKLFQPSFYNYLFAIDSLNDYTSSYYPIKVIEDQLPEIKITGIEEYTRLTYKDNHSIPIAIQVSDDYGLTDAYISATIAKGSGESVKFREKHIPLDNFNIGTLSFTGNHTFSTKDLEMEPGNELYFYIAAKDNCSFEDHWVKSLTYFIIIEDTVQYDYVDEGGMQVDLMPEFFRSQRQIIIDSEKLIKAKSSITSSEFNERSNELGFDQKQLRLKYGQFLGEESESGIAIETNIDDEDHEDHEHNSSSELSKDGKILDWGREVLEQFGHDHDHENEAGQRFEDNGTIKKEDPAKPSWVEELSHSHDNVEEATYFDMSIKTKLRAALSEMWSSELHLRLYDPASSLPYQYQALELLQEIKDHARVYVHRIGFDPPPIKESEKRLTGKQDEILNPSVSGELTEIDPYKGIKSLISFLSRIDESSSHDDQYIEKSFEEAKADIAALALKDLSLLPLLSELQKTSMGNVFNSSTIRTSIVEKLLLVLPNNVTEIKAQFLRPSSITISAINKLNSTR
jgi:hypothetical protein